jgi:hypothetical protein
MSHKVSEGSILFVFLGKTQTKINSLQVFYFFYKIIFFYIFISFFYTLPKKQFTIWQSHERCIPKKKKKRKKKLKILKLPAYGDMFL